MHLFSSVTLDDHHDLHAGHQHVAREQWCHLALQASRWSMLMRLLCEYMIYYFSGALGTDLLGWNLVVVQH